LGGLAAGRKKGFVAAPRNNSTSIEKVPPVSYFHDASKATLLPNGEGNNQIYYTIAGDDADFVIGGDIAGLVREIEQTYSEPRKGRYVTRPLVKANTSAARFPTDENTHDLVFS
jgi:hypothetical protein